MFGKLFNTLQQTINMEGPAAPGASGSSGPSFSGASLPSLADFGLGGLTGSAPQPPRPRAPGPGPGPPGAPRPPMAQRPPGPGGPPPDVDLTGLSEEEKAMIQSVMMRAQESEAAKVPQVTSQAIGAPRQPVPMQQGQIRPPVSQYAQQQQQQQRPSTAQYQQQPQASMSQAPRPQQLGMMQQRPPQPQLQQYQPQMQQPQQITRPQQQVQPGQISSQQQPSLSQQQPPPQQYPQTSQSSQPAIQNQYNVSVTAGMSTQAVSQPQVSMYQQQQPSTSLAMGYQPPMNQEQQMMDRQNFIESLQRQAQPDSVIQPPSSVSLTGSAPFTGPQQGLSQQTAPAVSSASSMNLGQNVITSMNQGQQQQPSSGYNSVMTTSSTLASNSSFQAPSSFSSSSVNQPSFVPSSMGPNSMQQALPNNSYQVNNKVLDERLMQAGGPRKMVHQQSWSEGTFESVLPAVDMSIYNQSGRRKSLEAMSALTEMGMSRVIEPFEIKLPKMTLSPEESESSSQVSGSEGRMEMDRNESLIGTGPSLQSAPAAMNIMITSATEVVRSPPREYKSVSQLANVSSCPVASSTISSCVDEPVLNVVLLPQTPQPEPIPIQIPPEPELSLKSFIAVQPSQSLPEPQPPVSSYHVGTAVVPAPLPPAIVPDTKDISVPKYSVRTMLTPVAGLRSFEEPLKEPARAVEVKDNPVSQYSVKTRLTPVSGLSSFEEPRTIPIQSSPSKSVIQTTAHYEFKTVQSTKSDQLSFIEKQSPDRTQIPDPNPLRKLSSEQISPPKSAVSSRKSSGIDFSTASVTSPDTEALMKTLSKYDPTKVIEPIIIPDLNLDSLLKSPPSFPKTSPPKSSPPKVAISSDRSIAHKALPHEKVMTMNPFSVILKSFEHDSPPGDENPSLVTHSSQTTPSCDFVEDQFLELAGRNQNRQQKQVKQKQHVTTQTSKSMIIVPSPPSSLPTTTRSPSPGPRTCNDRKLIKTNAIMTATTATSPLKIQREETRTSTESSQQVRGYDFMSVRKLAETERRASFGGSTGTAQSMNQHAGAEFTGRTGAQLPAIPSDTSSNVTNEKGFIWNRSGSLSEQAFIEQINEMRGLSVPGAATSGSGTGTGMRNDQTKNVDEQLNFEIDEDYEREGEEYFVEDDEDDMDVRRQQGLSDTGDVYTIPEESEEESPKVETKSVQAGGETRKVEGGSNEGLPRGVLIDPIHFVAPRASRSLPSVQ